MRVVLMAGDKGLTEEELEALYGEELSPADVDHAVEALLTSGLLKRIEARLHPSGAATRFNRLRPL